MYEKHISMIRGGRQSTMEAIQGRLSNFEKKWISAVNKVMASKVGIDNKWKLCVVFQNEDS